MGGEPECSIEMWKVNKYRLMTGSAVEGWNYKLNGRIGKIQPSIFCRYIVGGLVS
jgi:hypothetical protein